MIFLGGGTCLRTMVCYGEIRQFLKSGNAGICPAFSHPKSPVVRISMQKSKLNDSANVTDSQLSHSVPDRCHPSGNEWVDFDDVSSCQVSKITKASSVSTIQQVIVYARTEPCGCPWFPS